jgi:hypothetical protein
MKAPAGQGGRHSDENDPTVPSAVADGKPDRGDYIAGAAPHDRSARSVTLAARGGGRGDAPMTTARGPPTS